ncbi:glycosyltransferase [Dysgonomonas sp. 520]|uniref:glycosyltransferase n=1 Tax=Dysgonomonas sp. 520 TaxID=2302931 RepID=UPI0013D2DFAD|nr:glycosyltransferase [Dysgonomonas sp. 520]NDW10658.1 glycosyltransferase [Dysgonomonas sp. 520]
MEDFLNNIHFTKPELVSLGVFFLIFFIQILFYLVYYRRPANKQKKDNKNQDRVLNTGKPSVSVIIIAKNESENLAKNLPIVLDQDYPDFEVIVVNEGSTDESEKLLDRYSASHSNLYHTFSPDSRDRKLSMTIGIKAAKNDILLFCEANCRPVSRNWISLMAQNFTEDKDVVLGYSYITGKKRFFKRLACFDNLFFSLQYLSRAIKKKPFTGTYRNLAYRRELFFNNKGFSSVLNYENGEEVFINRIVTKENTAVEVHQDSFMEMDLDSYSTWRGLKTTYLRAKNYFKQDGHSIFSLEATTRYLFYLSFALLLTYGILSENWVYLGIIALLFFIRYFVQYFILKKASEYFKTPRFYISFILFDILQPIYNFRFKFLSRKKDNQKYRSAHM